jgi:hypothetical protein
MSAKYKHLLILLVCLMPFPSKAITLKNADSEARKLTIIEGARKTTIDIKPAELRNGICESTCEIETADGDVYEFDGNEFVVIEEGLLYIEDTPVRQ